MDAIGRAPAMNRAAIERELRKVSVRLQGWLPVLQCEVCKTRWEPFSVLIGSTEPTVRFDYWKCPRNCNAAAKVPREIQTAIPKYLVIDDVPGMIFSDEELPEFESYVRSMAATEIPNG
jgi:hypothetical protein